MDIEGRLGPPGEFEPEELPTLEELVEDLGVGLENMRRAIDNETGREIVVLKREDGSIVMIHAFPPDFLENLSRE